MTKVYWAQSRGKGQPSDCDTGMDLRKEKWKGEGLG